MWWSIPILVSAQESSEYNTRSTLKQRFAQLNSINAMIVILIRRTTGSINRRNNQLLSWLIAGYRITFSAAEYCDIGIYAYIPCRFFLQYAICMYSKMWKRNRDYIDLMLFLACVSRVELYLRYLTILYFLQIFYIFLFRSSMFCL